MSRLALGPTQPPVHWVLDGGIFPWVLTGVWAWPLTSIYPIYLHGIYRDNFTLNFLPLLHPVAQTHQWKVPSVPHSYTIFSPFKITDITPCLSMIITVHCVSTNKQITIHRIFSQCLKVNLSVALTEYRDYHFLWITGEPAYHNIMSKMKKKSSHICPQCRCSDLHVRI